MFRAYFDRSELAKPAPVMALSGYLSSDEEWAKFEPAWRTALERFGVEMFHMTEFECRHHPFDSWTNETRVNLLGHLLDVVSRHAIAGIGVGILMNDYANLSAEDQQLLGHPYAMCGLKAVADTFRFIDDLIAKKVSTGEWALTEKGKSVPVDFVFESGDEGAGELDEQLKKEQAGGKFAGRVLRWSFESKKGIGALQAADFAAYETTKQLVRTIGAEERAMRKSMEKFVANTAYVGEYFEARTLGELAAAVRNGKPG